MQPNVTNERPMTEARRKQLLAMLPAYHRGSDIGTEAADLRAAGIDPQNGEAVAAFRKGRAHEQKQAEMKRARGLT